jgi:hypothetical protein
MKFWPVVFWCSETKGDYLVYIPSLSTHKYPTESYATREAALRRAIKMIPRGRIHDEGLPASTVLPIFIPWVIEGERPDVSRSSTLRLLVQRINVNED